MSLAIYYRFFKVGLKLCYNFNFMRGTNDTFINTCIHFRSFFGTMCPLSMSCIVAGFCVAGWLCS